MAIEALSFISGENLFKYSFTMGVAMYVFAIIYPLEKKHGLQLEAVALEEQAALLGKNLDDLEKEYEALAVQKGQLEAKYDSASSTKSQTVYQAYLSDVNSYKLKKDSLDVKKEKLKEGDLRLKYGRTKLEVVESQIEEFSASFSWLKFGGICLTLFGFFFWSTQTFWDKPKKR